MNGPNCERIDGINSSQYEMIPDFGRIPTVANHGVEDT
jgi:hypothetical protein